MQSIPWGLPEGLGLGWRKRTVDALALVYSILALIPVPPPPSSLSSQFFSCVPQGSAFICLFSSFYIFPWVTITRAHDSKYILIIPKSKFSPDSSSRLPIHIYPATCQTCVPGCPTGISNKRTRRNYFLNQLLQLAGTSPPIVPTALQNPNAEK